MKNVIYLIASLFITTSVSATVIDFEELNYGQTVDYDHYESDGILFDASTSWGIYNFPGFEKTLINQSNFGGDLIASFTSLVNSVSILVGDWVSDTDTALLEVYDTGGQLIGSDSGTNNTGWFSVSVATSNIASLRVFTTGAVVFDEISFDQQTSSAVPEPSSVALLAIGFLALGLSRSRKLSS